jgi:hypothetical protein
VEWAIKISEAGIEGALADADLGAEAEAEADRAALIESQGEDVNSTEQAVDMIRRR